MPRDRDPDDARDLVKAVLRMAQSIAADIPESQWRAIEREAKAIYGGRKCYVRRPDAESPRRRARSTSDMPR